MRESLAFKTARVIEARSTTRSGHVLNGAEPFKAIMRLTFGLYLAVRLGEAINGAD